MPSQTVGSLWAMWAVMSGGSPGGPVRAPDHCRSPQQFPITSRMPIATLATKFTQTPRRKRKQLAHTASFAAFTGRALTLFRDGIALNTVGSFVNGLMPARSLVAGFLITTNFAKPGNKNAPFFFNSL